MNETKEFEPTKYLSKLQGRDYMEVKYRLLWLRWEHPDADIETELVKHDESFAMFRATVRIPGGGSATAYGSETVKDFRDHSEKAETKALGRALAHLGYGTQFAQELDEGDVVDSPVGRVVPTSGQGGSISAGRETSGGFNGNKSEATAQTQGRFAYRINNAKSGDELAQIAREVEASRPPAEMREFLSNKLAERSKALGGQVPARTGQTQRLPAR